MFSAPWLLLVTILALLGYVTRSTINEVRRGAMQPVTDTQRRSHREILGIVVALALVVIWLGR
jgi:hypothetical protein